MVPVIDVTKGPANGYKKVHRHSGGMTSFHYQRREESRPAELVVEPPASEPSSEEVVSAES